MGAAKLLDAQHMDAAALLRLLADDGVVTFQIFDDSSQKDPTLSRVLHGTLAEHAQTLARLNARGAGVFFMVNAGDGKGRATANVQRVRALFLDLDGSPIDPVQSASLPPHCIVESSPGRWHAYWRVSDCPLSDFKPLQQALAARFHGDVRVHDLPRVMRLPGFDHRKRAPFRSRIVSTSKRPPYRLAELAGAFDLRAPAASAMSPLQAAAAPTKPSRKRKLPDAITEGERNDTLLSLAAGLVRKGHAADAVTDRLQRINAERCLPPLCATEVDSIAARALGYGSEGFAKLPHALLDSAEWKALPPPVHDVILMAFRRFDGSNNGNLALTWEGDFKGLPGFSDSKALYRRVKAAVRSGILLQTMECRNTRNGRKPALFAIALKWVK